MDREQSILSPDVPLTPVSQTAPALHLVPCRFTPDSATSRLWPVLHLPSISQHLLPRDAVHTPLCRPHQTSQDQVQPQRFSRSDCRTEEGNGGDAGAHAGTDLGWSVPGAGSHHPTVVFVFGHPQQLHYCVGPSLLCSIPTQHIPGGRLCGTTTSKFSAPLCLRPSVCPVLPRPDAPRPVPCPGVRSCLQPLPTCRAVPTTVVHHHALGAQWCIAGTRWFWTAVHAVHSGILMLYNRRARYTGASAQCLSAEV